MDLVTWAWFQKPNKNGVLVSDLDVFGVGWVRLGSGNCLRILSLKKKKKPTQGLVPRLIENPNQIDFFKRI